MARSNEDVVNSLTYHPATPDTAREFSSVRDAVIYLSLEWNEHLPECREKSLALTALQEAMMWANASIAITSSPLATEEQKTTVQPTHGQE